MRNTKVKEKNITQTHQLSIEELAVRFPGCSLVKELFMEFMKVSQDFEALSQYACNHKDLKLAQLSAKRGRKYKEKAVLLAGNNSEKQLYA